MEPIHDGLPLRYIINITPDDISGAKSPQQMVELVEVHCLAAKHVLLKELLRNIKGKV